MRFKCGDQPEVNSVVVFDRSGSMSTTTNGSTTRIDLAKRAATLFGYALIGGTNTVDNEYVGLVSYNDAVTVDLGLSASRSVIPGSYTNAVGALTAGGSTDIGDALIAGVGVFGTAAKTRRECLVLMSDGEHNTNTDPTDPSVTSAISNRGVDIVHSIALGSQANESVMSGIANYGARQGIYRKALDSTELDVLRTLGVFVDMADSCRDATPIKTTRSSIPAASEQCTTYPVGELGQVDFSVVWADTRVPTVRVVRPNGLAEIRENNWTTLSGVNFVNAANYKQFSVNVTNSTQYGNYQVCIRNGSAQAQTVSTHVVTPKDNVQFAVLTNATSYSCSGIMQVTAYAALGGAPYAAASVNGTLTSEQGVTKSFKLYDDGAHEDGSAGDGVFGAAVYGFAGVGTNELVVELTSGTNVVRQRRTSVSVSGSQCLSCTVLETRTTPTNFVTTGQDQCFAIPPSQFPAYGSTISTQISPRDGSTMAGTITLNGVSYPLNAWNDLRSVPFTRDQYATVIVKADAAATNRTWSIQYW
ncbi:MAG: VWA domain-containing protein [Polyangiaceae bacterium]